MIPNSAGFIKSPVAGVMKFLSKAKLGVFRNDADEFKILIGYMFGFVAALYCLYAAETVGGDHELQVLICILGGCLGWGVGIYVTPTSRVEEKHLSSAAKLIITLFTGIGLGKAEVIVEHFNKVLSSDSSMWFRVLLFACMFLIFASFTYVSRLFVNGTEGDGRLSRDRTIGEIRAMLDKLEADR